MSRIVLPIVLAAALAACVDAHPATDAALAQEDCTSYGDGSDGARCCLWDAHGCAAGLACLWDGSTQNTGSCAPPPAAPLAAGATCDRYTDECGAGAWCLGVPGQSDHGVCRTLCNPTAPACAPGETCVVVSDEDASVGACENGGAS